jgi:hypothetical protein
MQLVPLHNGTKKEEEGLDAHDLEDDDVEEPEPSALWGCTMFRV